MTNIAVTGGIACGKSLVGAYLAEQGVPVCDADALAHDAMRKGNVAFDEVVSAFGQGLVGVDGELDRNDLGRIVFSDAVARETLNSIVHPRVEALMRIWLAEQTDRACVIVPLLFEAKMDRGWDAVVGVCSSRESQMARLAERGLSLQDAELRIEAQMPLRKKMEMVEFVIVNNGTKELLKRQTLKVMDNIMERENHA